MTERVENTNELQKSHLLHLVFATTNTGMGAFLRFWTRREINHCSVRFDDDTNFYSFRREYRHNVWSGRYGKENLEIMARGKELFYEEARIPLTEEEFIRMQEVMTGQKGHYYSFSSALLLWMGGKKKGTKKMICSTFVALLLSTKFSLDRAYYEYKPDDLRLEVIRHIREDAAWKDCEYLTQESGLLPQPEGVIPGK